MKDVIITKNYGLAFCLLVGLLAFPFGTVNAESPRCFTLGNSTADVPAECDNSIESNTGPLSDDKCYRETYTGNNHTGYNEFNCANIEGSTVLTFPPICYQTFFTEINGSAAIVTEKQDQCDLSLSSNEGPLQERLCYERYQNPTTQEYEDSYRRVNCDELEDNAQNPQIEQGVSLEQLIAQAQQENNDAFATNDFGAELEADCKEPGQLDASNCGIVKWINILINALTAVFGVIAIVMIAVGGVQYSFARDNPQQTAAAKERIRNVIIAIVAYVFLYGFMQYIIPGGIL